MKGSVFKRCTRCGNPVGNRTCRQCGSTSFTWTYRIDVGRGPDGRRIERRRSGFETKGQADRELTEVVTSLHEGSFVAKTDKTLGEYLIETWLPATAPPQVKPETWQDRARNLEQHVVARIGGIRLQELNAAHVNRLYADLLKEGRVREEGGLSPTTVRRIHAILRKALNDAVRWSLLEANPALSADPPPAKVVKASRRRSMNVWTGHQLRAFLHANRDHPHHSLWLFAATTGARRSEVLGLRWADLDLDRGTAHLHQTLVLSESGEYAPLEEQKSSTSARTIHLAERTIDALLKRCVAQEKLRGAAGTRWQDHDLVFTRDDGRWRDPRAVTQAFRRAVRSTDVPYVRFHDLRHTHATLLLKAGVNPKVVSERLGHSSVACTLDTYAHVIPGMQSEAASYFNDLVFGDDDVQNEDPENGLGDGERNEE